MPDVALAQVGLLGRAPHAAQILAHAVLIVEDFGLLGLQRGDFLIQVVDFVFLGHDARQRLLDLPINRALLHPEHNLLRGNVGQRVGSLLRILFAHHQFCGGFGLGLQLEAVVARRRLGGLGRLHQFPAVAHRMLHHHRAHLLAVVADGVGFLLHHLAVHPQHAAMDFHPLHPLAVALAVGGDLNAQVERVAEQAALARVDGFHQTLARKSVGVNDGEGAGVERQPARVLQPHRQPGPAPPIRLVEERHLLALHLSVQDEQQRRLVPTNRHRLPQLVLELLPQRLRLRSRQLRLPQRLTQCRGRSRIC